MLSTVKQPSIRQYTSIGQRLLSYYRSVMPLWKQIEKDECQLKNRWVRVVLGGKDYNSGNNNSNNHHSNTNSIQLMDTFHPATAYVTQQLNVLARMGQQAVRLFKEEQKRLNIIMERNINGINEINKRNEPKQSQFKKVYNNSQVRVTHQITSQTQNDGIGGFFAGVWRMVVGDGDKDVRAQMENKNSNSYINNLPSNSPSHSPSHSSINQPLTPNVQHHNHPSYNMFKHGPTQSLPVPHILFYKFITGAQQLMSKLNMEWSAVRLDRDGERDRMGVGERIRGQERKGNNRNHVTNGDRNRSQLSNTQFPQPYMQFRSFYTNLLDEYLGRQWHQSKEYFRLVEQMMQETQKVLVGLNVEMKGQENNQIIQGEYYLQQQSQQQKWEISKMNGVYGNRGEYHQKSNQQSSLNAKGGIQIDNRVLYEGRVVFEDKRDHSHHGYDIGDPFSINHFDNSDSGRPFNKQLSAGQSLTLSNENEFDYQEAYAMAYQQERGKGSYADKLLQPVNNNNLHDTLKGMELIEAEQINDYENKNNGSDDTNESEKAQINGQGTDQCKVNYDRINLQNGKNIDKIQNIQYYQSSKLQQDYSYLIPSEIKRNTEAKKRRQELQLVINNDNSNQLQYLSNQPPINDGMNVFHCPTSIPSPSLLCKPALVPLQIIGPKQFNTLNPSVAPNSLGVPIPSFTPSFTSIPLVVPSPIVTKTSQVTSPPPQITPFQPYSPSAASLLQQSAVIVPKGPKSIKQLIANYGPSNKVAPLFKTRKH